MNSIFRTFRKGVAFLTSRKELGVLTPTRTHENVGRVTAFFSIARTGPLCLPKEVDWRKENGVLRPIKDQQPYGVLRPIKDQQPYAFCAILAAISAMESTYSLKKGISIDLSYQYVINQIAREEKETNDCDISTEGVFLSDVLKFLVDHGTPLEKDFKAYRMPPMGDYITIPEFETEKMYKIDGYRVWFNPDEHFIMSMLAQQPFIANNVDARTWKYWSNENIVQCPQEITESSYLWPFADELDDCNVLPEFTDDSTDDSQIWSNVANDHRKHAVVLVGYGTEEVDSTPFWWVRNSWGKQFGIDGYAKVLRGNDAFDIESAIYVPILN